MVLEEVSSDPDPYFSPSSYDDPSNTAPQPPSTNLSRLPQPIPFSSAWGYTPRKLQAGIAIEQSSAQTLLQRPLTPPEADAIAFHFSKGFRYASFGPPLGVAAGIWRASSTMHEMRWPLIPKRWSDLSQWNYNAETQELSFRDVRYAKGEWVKPAIMGLRGLVLISFGYAVSGILFSSYGATVAAVGSIQDRRLKGVRDKINENVSKRTGELSQMQPPRAKAKVDPMGQGERTAAELWRDHRGAITRKADDASPTAGDADFYSDDTGANGAVMDDNRMRKQQRRQQPSPRRSATENPASSFQMEKTERQPQSFSEDNDATSPTSDFQTPTSTPSSSESTWDRIRRQSTSPGSSNPSQLPKQRRDRVRQEQQEESATSDSFSFSSSDSERAYAKDEAQKHFDERVEQERRGEDFGSGRSKRW